MGTVMTVRYLITGSLRLIYGHTSCCTAPKSIFFGELWGSQNSACNGSMTAHGCAGFSSLPLSHALNPLSIASLGRVVTGLNRCGAFRIQQQVLHSDAGYSFPVFPVVPLFFSSRNIGFCIRPGASFHFRAIKLNVSLSVCLALNRYIKIRKKFEDSKYAQISISGRPSCQLLRV